MFESSPGVEFKPEIVNFLNIREFGVRISEIRNILVLTPVTIYFKGVLKYVKEIFTFFKTLWNLIVELQFRIMKSSFSFVNKVFVSV